VCQRYGAAAADAAGTWERGCVQRRARRDIVETEAHGVSASVVPGISSALAVPASLNIPVTARGISESFWVVTGTTRSGEISRDIALAAQSSATVVILMGLNKIQDIMEQFGLHGKHDTPVAVIQNGTLPDQKNIIGKVSTIVGLTSQAHVGSPAIIIVGEVVNYAQALKEVVKEVIFQYQ